MTIAVPSHRAHGRQGDLNDQTAASESVPNAPQQEETDVNPQWLFLFTLYR
jgi:hypothetical protein